MRRARARSKTLAVLPYASSLVLLGAALTLASSCATKGKTPAEEGTPPAATNKEDIAPERATGVQLKELARAERFMIAAAHPDAAQAGVEALRAGGTALDAAVAVQMMLTLVEPQSSGIGGGAFLLYWDASEQRLYAYDGRETAPAASDPLQFTDDEGQPLGFFDAVVGGRSVGVPGVVRMLERAHDVHGRVPWARLFEPAIDKARAGFVIYDRLHQQIAMDPALRRLPAARAYFYDDDGEPLPVGFVRKNPALATTLQAIAAGGAKAFYEGPLAAKIVDAVQRAPISPGKLSLGDLASYHAEQRPPVCLDYRGKRVCGFPPPTSGGVTTLEMLGMLRSFDLGALEPRSAEAAHLLAEVGRYAYADRERYLADPAFVDVPVQGLLDDAYLKARAALIDPLRAARGEVVAGDPSAPKGALRYGPGRAPELPSTSHFVVFDAFGNVASMTTSVENVFGSRLMVEGFLLNNQLTDFSFLPVVDGRPVANALAPGKRPRSSMAPVIVFDEAGEPMLALGSPGGSRIIPFVVQTLVGVLDWDLDVQQAVSLPHVANRNGPTELEEALRTPEELASLRAALEQRGHDVVTGDMSSGLHAIERTKEGTLEGGADPRRTGVALGE